jgi:hypothetical protein
LKIRAHAPHTFFLKYRDNKRRERDGIRMDDSHHKQFLNNFLNFIFLGKGVTIRENIGRKSTKDKWDGVIMGATEGGSLWGFSKMCLERRNWMSR